MAGNNNGDTVQPIRVADCPVGLWRSNATRKVFIRDCLAVWNAEQLLPDILLKRCSGKGQVNFKPFEVALEVRLQFLSELLDVLIFARHNGAIEKPSQFGELSVKHSPIGKFQQADGLGGCSRNKGAKWTFNPRTHNAIGVPTPSRGITERAGECITEATV